MRVLPENDPNEAAHVNWHTRQVTLNSGAVVPIRTFWDQDGADVPDNELDLHDEIVVVFGPAANGKLYAHRMRRGDRGTVH